MVKNTTRKLAYIISFLTILAFCFGLDNGTTFAVSAPKNYLLATANASSNDAALSIGEVGFPSGILLSGDSATNSLFIPVNSGLSPKVLNLTLYPSPNMPSGKIWATVNGVVVSAEAIPQIPSTWSILLPNLSVTNGTASVVFHTAIQNPNMCLGNVLDWVQILPTSQIGYRIVPDASSVVISNFFPTYLNVARITVVPPLNTQKVQAVFDVASYLTHQYRSNNIAINVNTGNSVTPDASPFVRNVLIGGNKTAVLPIKGTKKQYYLSLGDSNLSAISKALFQTPQGPLLAPVSGLSGFNQISNPNQIQSQNVTFSSLGYSDEQVQGIGSLSINYTFSQADLGGAIQNLAVRLGGTHSPMISGATGYMTLSMNGTSFYNMPLNGANIDVYARVPNDLLQRDNTLSVDFQYSPSGGGCTIGSLPLQATIYKDSYLEFKSGQTLPKGFDQFPQNFTNHFHVYLSSLNLGNVQNAVALVQDLQQTTRTLLEPQLISSNVTDSTDGLLYIGQSSLPNSPITLQPFRLIDSHGNTVMTYRPNTTFAALEGYGSTLMLAGPQNLSTQLLTNGLSATGWYGLTGDVVLESGEVATHLTLQGSGLHVLLLSPSINELWQKYQYTILIGVLLILFIIIILLYPRLVRRKNSVLVDSKIDDKPSIDDGDAVNQQEVENDDWGNTPLSRTDKRKKRK